MTSRILSAALSCALLLPAMTGCGSTAASEPVTLAVVNGPTAWLAARDGHLYWSSFEGFGRVDVSGGPVERLSQVALHEFTVDDTHAYSAFFQDVLKVPRDGGDVIELAEAAKTEFGTPNGGPVAVDESSVYWGAADGVKKVSRDGGQVTVLSSGETAPSGLALDASDLYWTDFTARTVKRTPLEGGKTSVLASDQIAPHAIAVSGSFVLWVSSWRVHWMSKDGTTSASLPGDEGMATSLAVDDEHVYWTEFERGVVRRMPLAGGEVVTLARGETSALNIVVDDAGVYWTARQDPLHTALRKLSK